MPILPSQQRTGAVGGAGTVFGVTFGGILLLSLLIFLIFLVRRRNRGGKMDRRSTAAIDSLVEHAIQLPHSSFSAIPPSPELPSDHRPLVPHLTIPTSTPLMKSTFMDPALSAYSACIDSSESVSSEFSFSTQSVILHLGPSASRPYGLMTSDAAAAACPRITTVRPRRSLHPFSGPQLVTAPDPVGSMTHMAAIGEFPSPFTYRTETTGDTTAISPASKLSAELDEFSDTYFTSVLYDSPPIPGEATTRGVLHCRSVNSAQWDMILVAGLIFLGH
ncbi:hypothetical protein K438DRAFT_1984569 [Mycena galopus ATCC 62051]|nr:hypothetical protein K438DRAFT_1984569 [Mycena galopus ATCC 62051]